MSDWVFDLGNSRLKFAALDAGQPGEVRACAHDGAAFAGGWQDALPARIEVAWVASVAAPAPTQQLLVALAARCDRVCMARTQASLAGVRIAYAEPRRLGVDRFLALLGAHARGPGASLVVGVGTALTVDLLDATGLHRGGRIAPAPALMRDALHARAAQLPVSGGAYAEFAADTAGALASGCDGAALGLVNDSLAAASRILGAAPALLLHGGGAARLLPRLADAMHVPALVLEGLACWREATAAGGGR
jgi:type III pantothenate kinase